MIRLENVSKKFNDKFIIDTISFTAKKGQITGLIGHNGAGKTTIMRLIASILQPSSGDIYIDAIKVSPHSREIKQRLGVLFGGDASLYPNLTGKEQIQYWGRLRGLNHKMLEDQICKLDAFLHFTSFMQRQAHTYSRGMRQKISIAKAFIHNPDILILDEPTTGLDIGTTLGIHRLLGYLKAQNKTIILSTHNIYEIEKLFDALIILKNGRIIEQGSVCDILDCKKDIVEELYLKLGEES